MEKVFFIAALILVPLGTAAAQSAEVDLNTYYSYPVSAGVYYHQMSGIGNMALADFGINEISGEVRVTIPAIPELQPLLRGGYAGYAFTGDIDEVKQDWTHYHAFGGPAWHILPGYRASLRWGLIFSARCLSHTSLIS